MVILIVWGIGVGPMVKNQITAVKLEKGLLTEEVE